MLVATRAIACGFLLCASCVYGQDNPLERSASDFELKGVGLTETLLKFSRQQKLRIASEYVDRASMDKPVNVSLHNKTVRQGLDAILRNNQGYGWRLRDGMVEITNRHVSKRAQSQLNTVIPVFMISDGETARMASVMLWWTLQAKFGSPGKQLTNFKSERIADFHWSFDGSKFGLIRGHTDSDIVLIRDLEK